MASIPISTISSLNYHFKRFINNAPIYISHVGEPTNMVDKAITDDIKLYPVRLLKVNLGESLLIKSSIGRGGLAKCPWISIMNYSITESPRRGAYVAFLFSEDLTELYLTLVLGIEKGKKEKNISYIKSQLSNRLSFKWNESSNNIGEKYRDAVIFAAKWDVNNDQLGKEMLDDFLNFYLDNESVIKDVLDGVGSGVVPSQQKVVYPVQKEKEDVSQQEVKSKVDYQKKFSISEIIQHIESTNLIYDPLLIKRFAFSLMSKPFLILSGLAGSGKTQLALAFAKAMVEDASKQMCVVSVGADWTNREPLLGFPNALQENRYVKPESGVLDLLLEANRSENAGKPYFLILDEMNMSYVERYFADFLSSMESHEPMALWKGSDAEISQSISLPSNLFIVGTINVDETTYMFSPKVLDRANVIEFKVSESEMTQFLERMGSAEDGKYRDEEAIGGKAASMAGSFVEKAKERKWVADKSITDALEGFFTDLKQVNAEFGYRSAMEILRFAHHALHDDDSEEAFRLKVDQVIDCAVVQKLLPKLHGSRKKLEPVLKKLWDRCFDGRQSFVISHQYIEPERDGVANVDYKSPRFPLTADKICRMYESALANGFTSFAEA